MSDHTANGTHGITEDEAALYDRQIRLWGVEAQNKMRTASVLLVTLRGIAAEVAKNIVLAGIGNLTLLDDKSVTTDDLGSNFFLRETDVGQKRVEAAAPRIQALNPRVNLKSLTSITDLEDEAFLASFDLVVLTEVDALTITRVNSLTRKLGKKLFAAASIGMDGWVFADLLDHEFMVDKVKVLGQGESTKVPTKVTLSYTPFSKALEHSWVGIPTRTLKRISPSLWGILALFKAQLTFPEAHLTTEHLVDSAASVLPSVTTNTPLLKPEFLSRIAQAASTEFPPSVAILGGIVGQDVLNVLGGKEEPVRNFMVFEGLTGAGPVFQLGL